MNNDQLQSFEKQLKKYALVPPPAHLKKQVLAGQRGRSKISFYLKAAAVFVLFVSVPINTWIDSWTYTNDTVLSIQVTENQPEDFYSQEIMELAQRRVVFRELNTKPNRLKTIYIEMEEFIRL